VVYYLALLSLTGFAITATNLNNPLHCVDSQKHSSGSELGT